MIQELREPLPLVLAIKPNMCVSYVDTSSLPRSPKTALSFIDNFKVERKSNLLSVGSAKKLKAAINWMAFLSRPKYVYVRETNKRVKYSLSFITLTLPAKQEHSDAEIKKHALGPFLQWLRDAYGVKKYIWKAEIQKNGNIHFHITLDKFIHYQTLRTQWNKNINALGYVDRYRENTGKFTPPSTEIKAVKKVKNIAAYLAAYMAPSGGSRSKKGAQEYNSRILGGRLWGVSSYLSGLKSLVIEEGSRAFEPVMRYITQVCTRDFHKDFAHCYFFSSDEISMIIEDICDLFGFDWLCDRGFDIPDIGLLSAAYSTQNG